MSMPVPNKHPLPEISSGALVAALRAPSCVEPHFSAPPRFRTDRAGLSESRRCIGKPLPAAALTRKGFPAHSQTG
jgi:hypothetical protein